MSALDPLDQVLRDVGRERRELGVAQKRGQIDEVWRYLLGPCFCGRPPSVRCNKGWCRSLSRIVTTPIRQARVRQRACDPQGRRLSLLNRVTYAPEMPSQLIYECPLTAEREADECVLEDPSPEGFKR